MLAFQLILLALFQSEQSLAPPETPASQIIVEGQRASAELQQCLARSCDPDEDATASVTKARTEFAG